MEGIVALKVSGGMWGDVGCGRGGMEGGPWDGGMDHGSSKSQPWWTKRQGLRGEVLVEFCILKAGLQIWYLALRPRTIFSFMFSIACW